MTGSSACSVACPHACAASWFSASLLCRAAHGAGEDSAISHCWFMANEGWTGLGHLLHSRSIMAVLRGLLAHNRDADSSKLPKDAGLLHHHACHQRLQRVAQWACARPSTPATQQPPQPSAAPSTHSSNRRCRDEHQEAKVVHRIIQAPLQAPHAIGPHLGNGCTAADAGVTQCQS